MNTFCNISFEKHTEWAKEASLLVMLPGYPANDRGSFNQTIRGPWV